MTVAAVRPGPAGRRAAGLAVAAGLAAAAGQAPLGAWWLALAGHICLSWLIAGASSPRRAAVLALVAGTAHFAGALSWIVEPFLIDPVRHAWMAPFAIVLLSGGLALFWAAAGLVAARLFAGPSARALGFAGLLTLAELLRGIVLTGFPWALAGHVWIDTPVAQIAALAGADMLSLLLLLAAALPVAAGWRGGGVAVALVAGAWVWGQAQLARPDPARDPALTVRVVQPNADQSLKWDRDLARQHFDTLLHLTERPPAGPAPDLVIWPETSVPYLLDRAQGALVEIAAAAGGVPVAIGIQRTDGGWRGWNSLAVIGPGGEIQTVYDKHHLVPFGEYVPLGDLLADLANVRAFAAQEGNGYSAGIGPQLLDLGRLGTVLPLICYEAVFPRDLLAAPGRADWIVQITNDAWFGTLTGPWQHLAQARLRAIEQGLPLVRSANTGVSAVIDARGRVVSSLGLGQRGVLDAALPPSLPPTPYTRWRDWPLALLMLVLGIGLGLGQGALDDRRRGG